MVGVCIRNKGMRKLEMVFKTNFKANLGSDRPNTRMNQNSIEGE